MNTTTMIDVGEGKALTVTGYDSGGRADLWNGGSAAVCVDYATGFSIEMTLDQARGLARALNMAADSAKPGSGVDVGHGVVFIDRGVWSKVASAAKEAAARVAGEAA